jgi:UDP-N-acetylmuramoyl-L-alanyl-D-glutamate--2,6-diaminopimelate ligase
MRWNDISAELRSLKTAGGDAEIRGVHYDSRRVGPGDVFVAMRGGSTDGNRFVDTALQQGAAAIVTDSPEVFDQLQLNHPDLPVALVEHGRRALAEVSATVFGHPEHQLKLSAVTGTNGKTTTTFLLEQLLASVGRKSVLLGTIETHVAGEVRPTDHTTPESRDIYATFAEGVKAGCTEAVMEMSSHALEQERVWGLPVDVAIFTNLTQDHLDFHGTMGAYASAKMKIFAGVGARAPRIAIINADDPLGNVMRHKAISSGCALEWMYGWEATQRNGPEFQADHVNIGVGSTTFQWITPWGSVDIISPLSGRVNVYNLLAAMCAALARGLSLDQIASATPMLKQVPGRFEVVPGSERAGFSVVVDYAHTDDALKNLISLARESIGIHNGRVITLFGCGGDRDRTKRHKMGLAAAEASDLVIVTSDNPRSERPSAIIEEIIPGVRQTNTPLIVEEDRRAAIERAIRSAQPGDIVLLAGKGHEKVQIFADGAIPFDDVAEASRILQELSEVRA